MSIKYNGKLIAGKYKTQIVTDATESNKGLIRIATQEEINTGTDNTTAVTPKGLATKQNKLTAGTGIEILPDGTINNTQTSAEWGNIQGDITTQKDLQNALNTKANTITVNTELDKKVDKVEGKSLLLDTEITRLAGLKNYDDTALKKSVSDLSTTLDGKITDVETEVTDLSGRVTANEADIMLKANKTALDTKQDKLVSGTNIKTINNESLLGEGNIEFKSGGSGLELCDIGMALYVDETKGLRRYLNGQIVDRNTNTEAFFTRLQQITTLHPSLLCTEEEWQTAKTMSDFGQVGKFVFNYSGEDIVSVRLPRVVNVQGLFDLQNLGMTVSAGLPNITGSITPGNGASKEWTTYGYNGSLYITSGAQFGNQSGKGSVGAVIKFDASRSNSIYGKSSTVQQEAIQYPYFIQIATGSETENNIVNEIELNNPYSLFDSKYSDHELNNLSWLKSSGQWNAKAVYPDAYDKLLKVYNGTETVEGLSVKLSTETYTDYDFVLNTADETFRLPLLDGSEDLLSEKYVDLTLKASGSTYTAPANGYVYIYRTGLSDGNATYIAVVGSLGSKSVAVTGSLVTQNFLPVRKGQSFSVSYSGSTTGFTFRFTYAQGNGSLYYYVGETVQNANLIDAGRIGEQLANKVDITTPSIQAPYIKSTYVNGTSGYRIWSDGYCEQWGDTGMVGSADLTVNFIKKYNSTDYIVQINKYVIGTKFDSGIVIPNIAEKYNNRFVIKPGNSNNMISWRAAGYLAQGGY